MGASARHYKALMKKNCINWQRTPCGSICEILCPIMLMLILVYARSQIDPVDNEDFSLYSLRRPLYPIAKPEILTSSNTTQNVNLTELFTQGLQGQGNLTGLEDILTIEDISDPDKPATEKRYAVALTDQLRALNEYRDFFGYMDYHNVDFTYSFDVEQALEAAAELLSEQTGAPNIVDLGKDLKEDLRVILNLTRLIEQTPVANFTQVINWDGLKRLVEALGLDGIINVDEIKQFAELVEEVIENPELLIQDLTSINVAQEIENLIEQIPEVTDYITIDTVSLDIVGYLPLVDPLGPYLFYPSHCYPDGVGGNDFEDITKYNSPIIAVIRTGSSIEQHVIDQLESLFKFQKEIVTGSTVLGNLGFLEQLFDPEQIFSFIREEEIDAIAGQITDRLGTDVNATGFVDEYSEQFFEQETSVFTSEEVTNIGRFRIQEFGSIEELDAYIASDQVGTNPEVEGICYGFRIIENEEQNKYELELMFNDLWPGWLDSIPNQKKPVWNSYEYTPETDEYTDYFQSGFVYMQNWVANTILKQKTGVETASIVSMVTPMRLPEYEQDDFAELLTGVLAFFILIMYVPPIYRTAYRITQEKESRVKESMRMMGLKDFPYWASWFTYYTVVNTIISLITWVIMMTSITTKSAPVILFFIVWLFGQSLFGILLITQSLFTKARAAAITSSVVYFGTTTFGYFVSDEDSEFKNRMIASLSPTVALIQTIGCLAQFEGSQVGSTLDNVFSPFNNYSVGHGLIMMAVDCVWIVFLGFYMEQVMPKTFGKRRHPCFCFQPKFYGCKKSNKVKIGQGSEYQNANEAFAGQSDGQGAFESIEQTFKFETAFLNPDCYEKLTPEIEPKEIEKQYLKISNLHKQYENGFKAVNGINVKMYTDQIFCLLGHNGAGKTTTISMLTGLIGNTSGECTLFGNDMFNQMDLVRKDMGVCPQHDVLFDLLTPEEHLEIFYEFKGADKKNKKEEIQKLLHDIGVADKKDNLAYQLSGGNKRKLSVAIALCGNSKFVLLDEPTSGLDIQARRQLWNMLRKEKKNRIILLTTHYMDEADILGDRIGIMTGGKMTCLASSMFLKNRFGVGYVMTIVKNNPAQNTKVMDYMKQKLGPHVSKLTEIQGEMTIQIPREYTPLFKDFFTDFDNDLEELEIQTYGMSVTTLEQVFLEIGHDPNPKPKVVMYGDSSPESEMPSSTPGQASDDHDNVTNQDAARVGPVTDSRALPEENKGNDEPRQSFLPPIRGADTSGKERNNLENLVEANQSKQHQDSIAHLREDENPDTIFGDGDASKLTRNQLTPKKDLSDLEKQRNPFGQTNFDDEKDKFSLGSSKLNNSFCSNFKAVFLKRWNSYRRSMRRVLTEIFLPSAFMAFGVWISSVDFTRRSPSRLLTPSLYPLKQKLMFNQDIYDIEGSDLSPVIFAENMPGGEANWEVTFSDMTPGNTFDSYADALFDFGTSEAYKEPYMYGSYEVYQANRETQQYKFVSYINMTSDAASTLFPQFMYESILRVATDDPEFEFTTRSTPYPLTYEIRRRTATSDAGAVIFFAAIAYSIVITVTISYLVVERTSQLKHVQVITGMRLLAYWMVNFIFDSLKLYITIVTTLVLFKVFDQSYPSAVWVLVLFPFGIMPFTYVMSFLFTADSAAQTFTMFCHLFIILAASTLIFLLRLAPNLALLGDRLHWSFRIFPSYSIATSLYTDASIEFVSQVRNITDLEGVKVIDAPDISPDPWHILNNTLDIILQGAHFFFWFLVLFAIEADLGKRIGKCYHACRQRQFPKKKQDLKLDSDVVAEQNRVAETPREQLKIKVSNLRKVYDLQKGCCNCLSCKANALVAVENISFGLEAGECFALLGVNGAGKSTTFKSLTREVEPTSGSIDIGAFDIRKDFNKIKKLIGYCPQTNPIFEYMSVEENIDYFARIKGIPDTYKDKLVNKAIAQLDLESHRKKLAGALSGGNKRKLSVALAIVGSPPIILLDEPSAGMDPEARRFMWRVVGQIASDKTSAVILTTHSMEEAEALSSKMGIMVKGGIFKCFGTPQHIKDKFGTGYVIEIKAQQPGKEEIEEVRHGILAPESVEDPAIQEILKKESLSTEEASQALAAVQVPGIVIESILQLDQKPENEEDQEAIANEVLKKQFTLNEIAMEIFIKGALFGVIESLCHEFVNVEVIEHYGSYMRLRVERHEKSIGFLFKLVEELKEEHELEDYSVSQTTLEQIFQGFADLKFNENVPTYCIDGESGELAKIIFE